VAHAGHVPGVTGTLPTEPNMAFGEATGILKKRLRL